ncbi:MAG: hypothetical protein CMB55_07965 [Euryarchaeota archaeon]|nr:hypothetical protein [Euryarchaeota archaeon]
MKRKQNPIAKLLVSPLFRKRIVKKQKGKGSYERKEKHRKNKEKVTEYEI